MSKNTGAQAARRAFYDARRLKIVAWVAKHPGCTTAQVAVEFDFAFAPTKELLRKARELGELICVGRSTRAVWCLPDKPVPIPPRAAEKRKIDKRVGRSRVKPEPPPGFKHVLVPAANTKPPRLARWAVRSVFELGQSLG